MTAQREIEQRLAELIERENRFDSSRALYRERRQLQAQLASLKKEPTS